MAISWINPVALWGLALVAVPIAIHLLVRQHTRTVPYPSLRFVRQTTLAAFRRRSIQDALLLACRIGVVVAAALALAGPIFQTAARTASYDTRVSRAVVRLDDTSPAGEVNTNVFGAQAFQRVHVADAIRDAVRWLDQQPPSSREIVFAGQFRHGQIAEADLLAVPPGIGIHFAPAATPPPAIDRFTQTILTLRGGQPVFARREVRLGTDATQLTPGDITPAPNDLLRIVAAPADQRLADAALIAALEEGLRWPDAARRILVVWEGATAPEPNAEVLRMAVPEPPASAATAVWKTVDAATPRELADPVIIPHTDLDAWSRQPRGVSPNAQPADEGDRRWLWAAALALLAVEQWVRRGRASTAVHQEEQRVA